MCTKYDAFENYSRAIRCGALESKGLPVWDPLPESGDHILRHPLNGWVYEKVADDVVEVTTPKGVSGRFNVNGDWLDGELKDANPHLTLWVGGRQTPGPGTAAPARDPNMAQRLKDRLGVDASPRALGAEMQRQMLKDTIPSLADGIPDVELSSSIFLTVFPNWHPWGSFNQINYRFRPNGDNHEECIMECMFLAPIPENGEYEPVREIHWLAPDQDWTDAPELGMLAKIFNQDQRNLPFVYEGLKATARENLRLADYNELKLRHFHQLYEKWVGDF
jgi:hypothetical protein